MYLYWQIGFEEKKMKILRRFIGINLLGKFLIIVSISVSNFKFVL